MNLNIKNLQNEVLEREKRKIQSFEKVLDNCYSKILQANSKTNDCNCLYSVPIVMFGVPIYNLNDCITFIMEKLNKKGFKVYFTYPNLLFISWKLDDTRNTITTPNNSFIEYKSKPLLDYGIKKEIVKEQKNYRPITDYKEDKLFTNGDILSSLDMMMMNS